MKGDKKEDGKRGVGDMEGGAGPQRPRNCPAESVKGYGGGFESFINREAATALATTPEGDKMPRKKYLFYVVIDLFIFVDGRIYNECLQTNE